MWHFLKSLTETLGRHKKPVLFYKWRGKRAMMRVSIPALVVVIIILAISRWFGVMGQ